MFNEVLWIRIQIGVFGLEALPSLQPSSENNQLLKTWSFFIKLFTGPFPLFPKYRYGKSDTTELESNPDPHHWLKKHLRYKILFPAKASTLKKKVNDFPVPNRDVTDQTLPGKE